jgi:NAD(P)H-dependent flavin oxidoreductase YrpB (nitropropane dioxygenase family)
MWPNRRLIDLLGIKHPIVLSPMAGFGTVELAAAVCDAGALGSIGWTDVARGCRKDDPPVARNDQQADQRQFLLSCPGRRHER